MKARRTTFTLNISLLEVKEQGDKVKCVIIFFKIKTKNHKSISIHLAPFQHFCMHRPFYAQKTFIYNVFPPEFKQEHKKIPKRK